MPIGSYPYGMFTVPFNATPTFDLSTGNIFVMTLTGAVTVAVINPQAGHMYTFIFYQDSIGLHSVTWPGNFRGAISIPITALANTVATQTMVYDGTNFVAVSAGLINL